MWAETSLLRVDLIRITEPIEVQDSEWSKYRSIQSKTDSKWFRSTTSRSYQWSDLRFGFRNTPACPLISGIARVSIDCSIACTPTCLAYSRPFSVMVTLTPLNCALITVQRSRRQMTFIPFLLWFLLRVWLSKFYRRSSLRRTCPRSSLQWRIRENIQGKNQCTTRDRRQRRSQLCSTTHGEDVPQEEEDRKCVLLRRFLTIVWIANANSRRTETPHYVQARKEGKHACSRHNEDGHREVESSL